MELKKSFGLIFIALLTSCAQKSVITGGPKDVDGPKLVYANPNNEQTSFKGNQLEFRFDEYVQIKDFSDNVLVSPLIKDIGYSLKGKKLTVFWSDTLLENTTYSFFFGDAIVDLNESNPIEEKQFVISTGSEIDSLELKGEIRRSENNVPEDPCYVFLYRSADDSCIYKDFPDYITKSTKDGRFHFKYLAEGDYRLFALVDENGNYQYDELNERMAYLENFISISDSNAMQSLRSFIAIDSLNKITSKKHSYSELLELSFKNSVNDFGIELLKGQGKGQGYVSQWNKNKDSLKLWLPDYKDRDSIQLVLKEKYFLDTLVLYPNSKKGYSENKEQWSFNSSKEIVESDSICITFSDEIISYNFEKWELQKDSTLLDFIKNFDAKTNSFYLKGLSAGKYKLIIPNGNLSNPISLSNADSISVEFKVISKTTYGSCQMSISNPDSLNVVIELLNKDGLVIDQTSFNGHSFKWEKPLLKPGNYSFEAYIDQNQNMKWDTGNYLKSRQAEKRIIFKEVVQIRSNWDLELEWNLVED